MMKVSVIITTYNRPLFLKRVLEGYLQQTRLPDEIVIADDGSTKETAIMLNEIRPRSGIKVEHVWHEDLGFRASKIRNMAVAKSSGEYLVLCDDDSIPCVDMVKDHLGYAEEGFFIQGHRVLLGPRISASFTSKDIAPGRLALAAIKGDAGNIANSLRLPLPWIKRSQNPRGIRSCNLSLFRKDFLAVNGFNEDFEGWGKEDSELVARLYNHGVKRKDIRFRAVCYHLYHQPYDRERLAENTALLESTVQSGIFRCSNGVDKYLKGPLKK